MGDSEVKGQIVVAYYEAARAELLQRLEQRDNVVVLYVGAIGAIVSAGSDSFYFLGVVLPLVALGAAFIYTQHDRVMDFLSQYCEQLAPWIDKVWAGSSSESMPAPPSLDQEIWKKRRPPWVRLAARLLDRQLRLQLFLFVGPGLIGIVSAFTLTVTPSWADLWAGGGSLLIALTAALVLEKKPPQQNLWADSGSGSAPSV